MADSPYVGPRPFERADRYIFFGRDREVNELVSLVVAHPAVLLYSPSGAGKTSLLNAGLIPRLQEAGLEVLRIARVGGQTPAVVASENVPNIFAFNTLMSWVEPGDGAVATAEWLASQTIASFLGQGPPRTDDEGSPMACVLIFDQFEELFADHPERWRERAPFLIQIRESFEQALRHHRQLRVLFAMREEYVAQLDPYLALLPEKLRIRFRLEGLRKEAALDAVLRPLRDTRRRFAPGVAERLVRDLLEVRVEIEPGLVRHAEGEFVEPVQLQVTCQRLWQGLHPEEQEITSGHLETFGDVNQALSGFYETSIEQVSAETGVREQELRSWFEKVLVTPAGTRGTVFRGVNTTAGMPNKVIDALEKAHLIRGEWRAGARWLELIHDRLIEPIQQSNRKRLERFGPAAQIGQMLEQRAEEWVRKGRTSEGLLSEVELLEAERWASTAEAAELGRSDAVSDLLSASRLQQEREEQHRCMIEREARNADELRRLADELREARDYAEREAALAHARELAAAAISSLDKDPERSLLLALEAISGTTPVTPEAEDALRRALQASRIRLVLARHTREVNAIAFSQDGALLATAGADVVIHLWDLRTGARMRTLSGHTREVNCIALSPDGTRLVSGGADHAVKIWDTHSGEELPFQCRHDAEVNSVAFSPDGTRFASASADWSARLWDVQSGACLFTLRPHTNCLDSIAFSPDGRRLATGGADAVVKIWDPVSGQERVSVSAHGRAVLALAFSPDGTRLATASADATVRLWRASGDLLHELIGHGNWVRAVAFSRDGALLVTGSLDTTAKVWDAETGRELFTLSGHSGPVNSVAFHPSGDRVATGSADGTVRLWDISPEHELLTLSISCSVNEVVFSPDDRRLASASADWTARIWDAVSGIELQRLAGHGREVNGVAFSPDGGRLATASADRTARIWNAHSGQEIATLWGHGLEVNGIAFSPDGTSVATASADWTVRLWDASSGHELRRFDGHANAVDRVTFSSDGSFLASAGADGFARVWNVLTGRESPLAFVHTHARVRAVAFCPDDTRLATGAADGVVKLWDALSGECQHRLQADFARVNCVAFSPNGKRLATGGFDKLARLWDVESGREILSLSGHTKEIHTVAFSPDGARLATGGADGTIRLYTLDLEDLKALARFRVTRSLTAEERRKFHVD